MTNAATETRSVVVEREMPFPPEKIWRALTRPHLIEEWLMKNDFEAVVDRRFNLRADWGASGTRARHRDCFAPLAMTAIFRVIARSAATKQSRSGDAIR